jgi:deoxycitidine kinase/deoxyguanosine kinase
MGLIQSSILNQTKTNTLSQIVNDNNTKIISIEGNIGSGKSTLLANLQNHFANNKRILFLKEPVEDWEKIKDKNNVTMLEKFYKDQEKYSFSFQMMAYISRLVKLKEAIKKNPGAIIITERSLYTDKLVFAKMLFDNGKIELVNYQIYLQWFDHFASDFPIHKVIYVNTSPEMCSYRVNMRSRAGENKIPLDYLISCDKYHNEMLDTDSNVCVCQNQLILDGNIDLYEDKNIVNKWILEITNFIDEM